MLKIKCALDKELNQTTKGIFFEYQQQRTYESRTKIEIFRQCVGFKQFFQIPPAALYSIIQIKLVLILIILKSLNEG
jgi:hypothetical protein